MTRILMVNDIAEVGGGATAMLDVADVLLADGYDVDVACPAGPLAAGAEELGAAWHRFDFTERRMLTERGLFADRRAPRPSALRERRREGHRLVALADRVGADAVHTGALVPHLDAVAVRRRVPLVWHVNQVHPSYLVAGHLPDRIVSVSEAALAPLSRRASARLRSTVVPNGIDTDRFHPPTSAERAAARADLVLGDQPVVVTVARLEPAKGVDLVIEAVGRSNTRPVLVVVGVPPDDVAGREHVASLRRLAADFAVDVRFLGERNDVDVVLRAADVFAFGSRWEAFGLALAEASASGLPVVSTRAGGCAEVVADGVSGILVDVDDAAAMARSLDRLLTDADERARLGSAGRRRVAARFDRASLAERLLPVYWSLVRS